MFKSVVPLAVEKHKNMRLKPVADYGFAAGQTMCPITAVEFPRVAPIYPIVFLKDDAGDTGAFALLAVPNGKNLFIDENGAWRASYVPASIRRFPFVFGRTSADDKNLALCIDEDNDHVSETEGAPLFTEDGKPTDILEKAIEFMKQFQTNHTHTIAICQELDRLEMFQDLKARVQLPSGRKYDFVGARIIDEKKLSTLADADFLEWRKRGWLSLIYAHLISLGQITHLAELHEQGDDSGPAAGAAES
jgi:hypothetical protein